MLVLVGVVALLSGLILSSVSRARRMAQGAACVANLHSIHSGFVQFSMDNQNRYPDPISVNASWESMLRPYLSQSLVFACPADVEVFPTVGSSYDWRDVPDPACSLCGRRTIDVRRADVVLAFETLPGWHAPHTMNALLVSGAALPMDEDRCLRDLKTPLDPQQP